MYNNNFFREITIQMSRNQRRKQEIENLRSNNEKQIQKERLTKKAKANLEHQKSQSITALYELNMNQILLIINDRKEKELFFCEYKQLTTNNQRNKILYQVLNQKKLLVMLRNPLCWHPIVTLMFPRITFSSAYDTMTHNRNTTMNLLRLSSVCKDFYAGLEPFKTSSIIRQRNFIKTQDKVANLLMDRSFFDVLINHSHFTIKDAGRIVRTSKNFQFVQNQKFDNHFPKRLKCSECQQRICFVGTKISLNYNELCGVCNGTPELYAKFGDRFFAKTYVRCWCCDCEFFLNKDYLGTRPRCPMCR